MRFSTNPKMGAFPRTGIARPAMAVVSVLLLVLAGPALGGRKAPAVWVPMAPAGVGTPMVLVPFQDTLYLPDPGQRPAPWVPSYLRPPTAGAVQSGVLPRDLGGAAPTLTLSDMLRDAKWRRQTAKRLRRGPAIKSRF